MAYTTGRGAEAKKVGVALRLHEPISIGQTLDRFLTICGKTDAGHCAFSAGGAAATHKKYRTLMNTLRAHPGVIGQDTYTLPGTLSYVKSALEAIVPIPVSAEGGWPSVASLLQRLWEARGTHASTATATATGRATGRATGTARSGGTYEKYAGVEQGAAVICSESQNPRDPASYPRQAAQAAARYGDLGRMEAWLPAVCATWPVTDSDRYTGPWNRRTANPILVIGTKYDPADYYQSAVTLSRELNRARLLTVDGYGHGALQNASTCADAYETGYLLGGAPPPSGAVCHQDRRPFTG